MGAHVQAWFKVKLTDEHRVQIRDWIKNEKEFDPEEITLGPGEVLVEVKKECCALTSQGQA